MEKSRVFEVAREKLKRGTLTQLEFDQIVSADFRKHQLEGDAAIGVAKEKLLRGHLTQTEYDQIIVADYRKRQMERLEKSNITEAPSVDSVCYRTGGMAFTSTVPAKWCSFEVQSTHSTT